MTIFAAAGSGAHSPQQLLADRVSASLTGAAMILALALIATLIAHPRNRRITLADRPAEQPPAATPTPAPPGADLLTRSRTAA